MTERKRTRPNANPERLVRALACVQVRAGCNILKEGWGWTPLRGATTPSTHRTLEGLISASFKADPHFASDHLRSTAVSFVQQEAA